MSRIQARELAFEKIFSQMFTLDKDISKEEKEDRLNEFTSTEDLQFISNLLSNYAKNYQEINDNISKGLKKYTLEKLYRVDLAIICVSMTELFYLQDTPISVVISEAVQLAKKYSTANSHKFINGFLADIIKKHNINYKIEPVAKTVAVQNVNEKEAAAHTEATVATLKKEHQQELSLEQSDSLPKKSQKVAIKRNSTKK